MKRNGVTGVECQQAAVGEMAARATQERQLIGLRQQGLEGMAAGNDEIELAAEIEAAEIAIDPADRKRAGLIAAYASIAGDRSIPVTSLPRRASGMASRPVPQPRSRTRGPQRLRQRQEELAVVVDGAILGVVADGIVVLLDASHAETAYFGYLGWAGGRGAGSFQRNDRFA